ncbi:hypothetical protein [Micromonospora sp. NPDC050276]|uniref:hypothetical protein n=1 Tax=Micromonospora sp. NPDC050276 TaxID=3364278 RepID=UPI0037AB7EDD
MSAATKGVQGSGWGVLVADLALGLVKAQTGQTMDDLVRELSLLLAETAQSPPA